MSIIRVVENVVAPGQFFQLLAKTIYICLETVQGSPDILWSVFLTNSDGTRAGKFNYDKNIYFYQMTGLEFVMWPGEGEVVWRTPTIEPGTVGTFALVPITGGIVADDYPVEGVLNVMVCQSVWATSRRINRDNVTQMEWVEEFLICLHNNGNGLLKRDKENISGTIIPFINELSEKLLKDNTLQFNPQANYSV
ncbi:hypothetical protein BDQ17DRAFT_1427888 [Cyathus striatus]|nr:hypothetical protein BDQ17DRAFT_1427888 [Cyathus striatus]